jgi:hypothetical protein
MSKEPRIIAVEPFGPITDIGADVAKSIPAHSRYRYRQSVRYTTEDGQAIDTTMHALTKPKLAERIERQARSAQDGELFANIGSAGDYRGTILKMSLIPR